MGRTLSLLILLLPWAGTAFAAEEIAVDLAWDSDDRRSYPYQTLTLDKEPPGQTEALKVDGDLRYGKTAFAGDRELLVAVDLTKEASRLWIDQDFDGQFEKEKPFTLPAAKSIHSTKVVVYLPLQLDGEPDGLSIRIDFALRWRDRPKKDEAEKLDMTVRAHRTGRVLLEGRVREILLEGRESDLCFDRADNARLYLDLDGDGALQRGTRSPDHVEIGKPFRLRDRGYVARVIGVTGRQLVFFPTDDVPPPRAKPLQRPHIPPAGHRAVLIPGAFEKAKADYEFAVEQQAEGKRVRLSRYVTKIGRAGTKDAFNYLLKIYRSSRSPSYLKVAAVTAMSNGHYVEFAPKVARIAKTARDPIVTIAAVQALHFMGDPDRERTYAQVLRRANDASAFKVVAEHLGFLQTESALQVLDEALAKETRPERLEMLYHAAMHFGKEPPSSERVRALLASEKERVRMMALRDAQRFGMPDLPSLAMTAARKGAKDHALRNLLLEILGRRADAMSLAVLLPLLSDAGTLAGERFATLLKTLRDPAAAEVLLGQLDHRQPRLRIIVADALARIPSERVRDALRARLKPERDPAALAAVMRASGGHRDEQAAALIVAAARRFAREEAVQKAAVDALARIGFGPPCVTEFFTQRLAETEGEARLEIIEAAVASGHPGAGPVLAALLAEPDWDTRYAVAQGLGRLRVKSGIAALIAVLRDERNTRVRKAVAHALFATTGQYLQDDYETWTRWWEAHGKDFEVPAETPSLPSKQADRPYATTFYGVPVETKRARVIFVIDKSGSMGNQLVRAQEEALKVIKKLDDKSRTNVIFFESVISFWNRRLQPLTRASRKDLADYMETQFPQGGTNLWDGLKMALDTKGVETIYLLSDGQPNVGALRYADDITEAVRKINRKRRIVIHGVSLGRHSKLLKDLAEENGGIYTRI